MTELELSNLALSSLGHERPIGQMDEQSKGAMVCRHWLASARRSVLGAAFWPGLTLVREMEGAPEGSWWRYGVPECGAALRYEALDEQRRPIEIVAVERHAMILKAPRAVVRYVPDRDDLDGWPHLVLMAVVAELAALVAYSLTGQRGTANDAQLVAQGALSKARAELGSVTRAIGESERYVKARQEGWQ